MLSNLLFEYAIASKKCDISTKKIEIVLVSSAHTANYYSISLTPLFFHQIM